MTVEKNVAYGLLRDGVGRAEARVADGQVEGWVLIWPVEDAANAPRVAAEIRDSFTRAMPTRAVRDAEAAAAAAAAAPVEAAPATDIPAVTPAN